MKSHVRKLIALSRSVRAGHFPYENREWLRRLYEDERMTLRGIAAEGGCALRTVARWMKIHDIPVRDVNERYANRKSGADNPRWRGGPKPCPSCGAPKTQGGPAKRCMNCRNRAFAGSGNPNYRGLANIMALVRQWVRENWRPAVMARDRYICCVCGDDRGHNLQAHHRIRLSDLVRRIYERDKPDLSSPAARLAFVAALCADPLIASIENGTTICKPCHKDAHKHGGHTDAVPRKRKQPRGGAA